MKPSELKPVLKTGWQHRENIIVAGDPGCGKSETIDQTVAEMGADYLIRHPCNEESVDSRGYPALANTEPTETQKRMRGWPARYAEWVPFRDMHELITAQKLTVVHLEDFIQAMASTQAGYMQVMQRRELNGFKISDNIVFVISTNRGTDLAGGSFILEPLKGRNTILNMDTNVDDWAEWAVMHNVPTWLISFIIATPDALHQFKATRDLTNSANPRNWFHVGQWSNYGVNNAEVWEGRVGKGLAAQAFAFYQACLHLPSPKDALADPEHTRIPDEPNHRYGMAVACAYNATKVSFENMSIYCKRLGDIYHAVAMKLAPKHNPELYETKTYNEHARQDATVQSYL